MITEKEKITSPEHRKEPVGEDTETEITEVFSDLITAVQRLIKPTAIIQEITENAIILPSQIT